MSGMRFLFILTILLSCNFIKAQHISQTIVWPQSSSGDSIKEHFVYGLAVTKYGTILSFAEARLILGDASPHHIVMKRSLDNGANWETSQIVIKSEKGSCYANPTPIVDSQTGAIYLFFARNYDNDSSHVFYITSKDDGLHWSDPIDVTSLFKNDPHQRNFHLPGPGHGISLSNGRLLLQVWHRHSIRISGSSRAYGVSTIFSDDHGKTWLAGNYAPQTDSLQGNESRLLEISNGDVIMNARPSNGSKHQKRLLSVSKDRGETWGAFCESSMQAFSPVDMGFNKISINSKIYFLASFPSGPGRRNLVLCFSNNEGKTWQKTKLICEGIVSYSDMAILKDGSLLILYGKGNPKHVIACRLDNEWLRMSFYDT